MTVYGWDASHYDWTRGPMDLVAARKAGIDFFTHKSSEGTSYADPKFGAAMARAKAAGIPVLGAYHVARSPANAAAEVDYWIRTVTAAAPWWVDHPGWFWPVDLEKWPYDPVPASEGEQVADIIEQRTGRRAVIYASKGQYGDGLSGTSHHLWNARYPYNLTEDYKVAYTRAGGDQGSGWQTYSGRMPILWQYTSTARIGTQGTCDANAYRGTLDELRALLTGAPAPAPAVEDDMFLVELDDGKPEANGVWKSDGFECEGLADWATGKRYMAELGWKKLIVTPDQFAKVAGQPRSVVAGLDPAATAAAIVAVLPATLARQVADELAARLQS
jgi:GH25 family lysozyme M1 (1,4-beta-N-acetylmuramidase)